MRRIILSLVFALLFQSLSYSQSAMEGKVEYQKGPKIAAVIELPYPEGVVEDAIKGYLSKKGMKGDKSKGFNIYRGVRLRDGDPEETDLHFKIEQKSRREKNSSTVYLLVGRPGENISARTADDNYKVDEGKVFLNGLVSSVEAQNLEVEINQQDESVKKAERKLRNLEDEEKDLEKRIRNLEEKLQENRNEQQKQVDEVSKQKSTREAMQSRRRN